MCGVVGILANNHSDISVIYDLVDVLKHRGPDGDGVYIDANPYIALGHTRLSIIDLSDSGAQPQESSTGRYVISYNGEIYNHIRLRQEINSKLQGGVRWRGNSDTETLLMCFECFGIRVTLQKMMGMFSIAVWDKKHRELTLVRDRFGEKPLYYSRFGGSEGGVFVFASDLRAIRKHCRYNGGISSKALAYFGQYNYIPAPYTIYDNIFKLNPGCLMTVSYKDGLWKEADPIEIEWAKAFGDDKQQELSSAPVIEKTVGDLRDLLVEVVSDYCISDVPIGSFLSGGIDSTLITSVMQSLSDVPVNTFTIGSEDEFYDESKYAKSVAKYLGTNHHELILSPADVTNIIPDLCNIYDEPFADSSQIPMVLLSRFSKQHVSVTLSGDGGDEIFGGYNRYVWGESIFRLINTVPMPLRGMVGAVLKYLSREEMQSIVNKSLKVIPSGMRVSLPSDKIRKISDAMNSQSQIDLYESLVKVSDSKIVSDIQFMGTLSKIVKYWDDDASFANNAMVVDRRTYLTDDILVKTDRAAMSVGLENRSPFLDYRVMTFADSLPDYYKIRGKQGKWILRQLLHSYIPKSLTDRPKTGFSIPIGRWLRGPLKEWAGDLLSKDNINKYGYLDYEYVSSIWNSHLSGSEMHNELWGAIILQNWLENQTN